MSYRVYVGNNKKKKKEKKERKIKNKWNDVMHIKFQEQKKVLVTDQGPVLRRSLSFQHSNLTHVSVSLNIYNLSV